LACFIFGDRNEWTVSMVGCFVILTVFGQLNVSISEFVSVIILKNAVFWDLVPGRSSVSSLADFSTLKIEAISSSETSIHTRNTRHHIPEECILHSHHRENLKSYIFLSFGPVSRNI
jgi:hypothetical protein